MMEIKLSNSDKSAFIDDDNHGWLSKYLWRIVKPRTLGATEYVETAFCVKGFSQIHVFMHQLAIPWIDGMEPDHKNYNELDNQRDNLRYATRSQQCQNRRHRVTASAPYKGVRLEPRYTKSHKPWSARILANGMRFSLGTFASAEEVALAYNKAALEHFGDFAFLNEIRS